jgi:hypothetical protein
MKKRVRALTLFFACEPGRAYTRYFQACARNEKSSCTFSHFL